MSSALQIALATNQQNNYMALAILTAVGYDYILTFSDEIEYIWNKPWTWMSMLFIFVRYFGLFSVVISSLVAMILRVWVLYGRSRLILGALLTPFSLMVIFVAVATALDDEPGNQSVSTTLQIIEGAALLSLVIFHFVRELLQMYRATKRWQLDRYMNLFVKQGFLYFLAIFCFSLITVLAASGKLPEGGWQTIPLFILEEAPMYILGPRFIMGIRKVYEHDVQGRCGSRIDTAFGLSLPDCGADRTAMFVDVEELNDGLEGVDEIKMATMTSQMEQAGIGGQPSLEA
ncbi:hypothetical protein HD554DRAFT_2263343 [Boletus coccyginus]|nr:hypothetical protein HD554DRAFT_2263343 [Boletus coccyginus]